MSFSQNLSLFSFLLTVALPLSQAATFNIHNSCQFTVWAAAIPGGGRQLEGGQTWTINVKAGTTQARIWARTNCIFDGPGRGKCETGDCGGVLQCQAYGQPPNTLAEYSLNQFNNVDFYDISLVDGFNVPMEFSPTSGGCNKVIRCTADINGQCPNQLKAPGGCNNPCTVFKTDEYCCNSGNCGPTDYSRFFKDRCPDAYSYPKDDQTSTFKCPGGTNYKVVLCPGGISTARIHIQNNCSYTVWAAANPGGGKQLNQGQQWTLNITWEKGGGRIWGRTGCNFDSNGHGKCESGDCNGLLKCQADGRGPNTIAEYGTYANTASTYFAISLANGFNIPMEFSPISNSEGCQKIKCAADINGPCPMELRDPGGCNNPCTIFRNDQFCCHSGICKPTSYSKFFKDLCPDANSYPLDTTSSFFCPNATDYNVVFCP